jgi:hypothetical protein
MNLKPASIVLLALASGGASFVTSGAAAQGLSERLRGVAEQRREERAQDTGRASLLGALLYTDISVNFDKTTARTAFEYIASELGVPLVVRFEGDRGSGASSNIDPELEISLQVDRAPAITVLERMLEMCSTEEPCTWQLRDGFIEAGTKGALSVPAARELRMYPVRDLLFEPTYFDNAPDFNLSAALSQGNQQGGQGGGSGGGFGGGGGGFGGGGGGFGGGGGGSGGSGGGGGIIGDPGEEPERKSEDEKSEQLMDIIKDQCEPEAWTDNGGDAASRRYYQGVLIIRAPDFIHRQIDGYPFAPKRPLRATTSSSASADTVGVERRYVTFTTSFSVVDNVTLRGVPVQGAVGNNGGTTGSPIVKDPGTTPPAKPGDAGKGSDRGKPAAPKP